MSSSQDGYWKGAKWEERISFMLMMCWDLRRVAHKGYTQLIDYVKTVDATIDQLPIKANDRFTEWLKTYKPVKIIIKDNSPVTINNAKFNEKLYFYNDKLRAMTIICELVGLLAKVKEEGRHGRSPDWVTTEEKAPEK